MMDIEKTIKERIKVNEYNSDYCGSSCVYRTCTEYSKCGRCDLFREDLVIKREAREASEVLRCEMCKDFMNSKGTKERIIAIKVKLKDILYYSKKKVGLWNWYVEHGADGEDFIEVSLTKYQYEVMNSIEEV